MAVVVSAGPKGRRRPSQSVNDPAFSTTGATGNTTSANAVTGDSRNSRLTTNPAASIAARAACGSVRSAGSIPPISNPASSPCAAAVRIAAVSRPGPAGRSVMFQASLIRWRARGSVTGCPPGSTVGRQPASRAPRSPARRGIQASRDPVRSASATAADSAPGLVARRSPARITAPGSRSAAVRASSAAASAPGTVRMCRAASFAVPREASGAIAITGRCRRRTALRSRRNTIGDSSSGSNPTRTTTGAASRSA